MHDSDSLVATAVDLENHTPHLSRAFHDGEGNETLVQTVLEALADASGRPIDELGVCLYDAVDPDALNQLFSPTRDGSPRAEGRVSFTVGEFAVDVHSSGHVFVRQLG